MSDRNREQENFCIGNQSTWEMLQSTRISVSRLYMKVKPTKFHDREQTETWVIYFRNIQSTRGFCKSTIEGVVDYTRRSSRLIKVFVCVQGFSQISKITQKYQNVQQRQNNTRCLSIIKISINLVGINILPLLMMTTCDNSPCSKTPPAVNRL